MQAELAGVNGGEEVGADLGEEAAGDHDQEEECRCDQETVVEGPVEQPSVKAAEFFKQIVEERVRLNEEEHETHDGRECEGVQRDGLTMKQEPGERGRSAGGGSMAAHEESQPRR